MTKPDKVIKTNAGSHGVYLSIKLLADHCQVEWAPLYRALYPALDVKLTGGAREREALGRN